MKTSMSQRRINIDSMLLKDISIDALEEAIRNNGEYPVSTSDAVRVISYLDNFRAKR